MIKCNIFHISEQFNLPIWLHFKFHAFSRTAKKTFIAKFLKQHHQRTTKPSQVHASMFLPLCAERRVMSIKF